jgi:zinc transport system substrate-binding protein
MTVNAVIWRLVGCGSLAAALLGCGARQDDPAGRQLMVAVTIAPQAEFVERVGGGRVEPIVMVPPGAEPHAYEPTPQQLVRLSTAQAYAQLGSGIAFESVWMARIRDTNPSLLVIDCAAGIQRVEGDPHLWLSLRHARTMADAIRAGLTRLDPGGAVVYQRNFDTYAAELAQLDSALARQLRASGVRAFLVYHPSWGYFARDYGLDQMGVERDGREPTARQLAQLVDEARAAGLRTLFVSPQFEPRPALAVAAEIGATVLTADPLPRHYLEEMRRFGAALAASGR